jgi:hypothetical protein
MTKIPTMVFPGNEEIKEKADQDKAEEKQRLTQEKGTDKKWQDKNGEQSHQNGDDYQVKALGLSIFHGRGLSFFFHYPNMDREKFSYY